MSANPNESRDSNKPFMHCNCFTELQPLSLTSGSGNAQAGIFPACQVRIGFGMWHDVRRHSQILAGDKIAALALNPCCAIGGIEDGCPAWRSTSYRAALQNNDRRPAPPADPRRDRPDRPQFVLVCPGLVFGEAISLHWASDAR